MVLCHLVVLPRFLPVPADHACWPGGRGRAAVESLNGVWAVLDIEGKDFDIDMSTWWG